MDKLRLSWCRKKRWLWVWFSLRFINYFHIPALAWQSPGLNSATQFKISRIWLSLCRLCCVRNKAINCKKNKKKKNSRNIDTSHSRLHARWKDDGQFVHSRSFSVSPQTKHQVMWDVIGNLLDEHDFWKIIIIYFYNFN